MRRARRPSTGVRRDDGVKVIRTNDVRYPDVEHPLVDQLADQSDARDSSERGLAPALDTGLAVESRVDRQQRKRTNAQRRRVIVALGVIVALVGAVFGWRFVSDRRAATAPLFANAATMGGGDATPVVSGHDSGKSGTSVSAMPTTAADPTPYFARYGRLVLRLPVPLKSLTEVGFHQASYGYALPMKTQLPDANMTLAANHRGTGRNIAKQPSDPNAWLIGSVLRMWRPRPGRPDTAVDVGALPGTPILAPVTGTVVKIKPYLLYGRYPDDEVHIHADGFDDVDVVMIHVKNPDVKAGDRVIAGVTRIGVIRKFSDKFHDQLADYTKGGGDHVHVAINNVNDPRYRGLAGAIDPDE